jgi:hypothetical protein
VSRAEFDIPGSFPSVSNLREHWSMRARRAKRHRYDAELLTTHHAGLPLSADVMAFGGMVTLTRHAPRKLDTDNLAGALKAARDGIAAALGVDDGDPRIEWRYAQAKCKAGEQRVSVVVAAGRPCACGGRG